MQKSEKEKLVAKLRRAADAQRRAYSGNLYHEGIAQGLDDAAGILGKVRCEEEPHWIPCSERLPDIGVGVLGRSKGGTVDVVWRTLFSNPPGAWDTNGLIPIEELIAWMPLPELKPWKEEE